ncbi:NCS2 family permease [Acholeplasma hippikon]|uniref:Guanine/hypoxanthine permease pbuG n=1 Tax=Acholeplasma hippikon TaxID=264636 RepID=A0A449BKW5_9MOLU|nr:NCS2 family permease [Acholeplasma hippikon]VEU83074.1 Guanine/hypoxanthine permease pbuG [Acholeplasma hippikon]
MNSIKKFFKFEERKTNFKSEIIGGLVTFLAMSYILAVNPSMISASGIPLGGAFLATAIGAAIATLVMAFVANYPVALAPGMGVNAFFTFTIVMTIGYTWQEALAISFIGGVIFVAITFTPLRQKLIEAIPAGLRAAIGAGIGFFIAFVGLNNAKIIVADPATLVKVGNLTDPSVLVALFGIILIIVLHNLKNKLSRFSFIISIAATALLYVILSLAGVKGLQEVNIDPNGYAGLAGFKESFFGFVKGFGTLFQDTQGGLSSSAKLTTLPVILFALVFVDIFDTAGTLVGVTKVAGIQNEDGSIPNLEKALFADAIGTLISSSLGTPEITSFVESSTGVESGARTGFSNIVVAILFLLSILLYPLMPIFNIFPITSMALVLVGVLMAGQIAEIDWSDKAVALASFLTIIGMVLSYSVADGIAFGFISYAVAMLAQKRGKEVHPLIYIFSVAFVVYFILYSKGFQL